METRGLIRRIAKADFADVLGVALRGDTLAVAHLRKRVNVVRVVEVARLQLGGPAESRQAEAAAQLRAFVQQRELEPSRVALAVERPATLLANVAIPASAAANADDVIRFEIDRLIPAPAESLYWASVTRPLGTVGERVGVTVFAAPRPAVDEAMEVGRQAGLPVSAVTAEPVALADYLGFCGVALAAVATRSGARDFVTLVADGVAVSSRHLGRAGGGLREAAGREVDTALPERSGQVPVLLRGEAGGGDEEGERALATVAPADLLPPGAVVGEAEVVAIGAALGLVGEGRQDVNLLPDALVQTASGFGLRELALSGAVAAMALLLFGSIVAKNVAIASSIGSELEELEPRVEQALRRQDRNAEMLAKIERLEAGSRSRTLTYLKAVTDLVPTSAYLTTFRYRENKIEVDGIADKASDLIAILESSPYFRNVEFTSPTTKYLANQERFSLRMRLEQ